MTRRTKLVLLPAAGLVAAAALLTATVLVGRGGGTSAGTGPGQFRGTELSPAEGAPPLALRDVSGRRVDLRQFRGKAVLVTFIYSTCPDICPITVDKIRSAQVRLGARARDLQVVAVSVDPAGDTPANVRRFVRGHGMNGHMLYLRGTRPQLEAVWKAWGVAVQVDPESPRLVAHSGTVFGVDAAGRRRVLYAQTFTPSDITHDVPALARAN